MEALGDLLRWWQALSQHSRMAYAIVSVTVAVALGALVYQGYCGPAVPTSLDAEQRERTAPVPRPTNVLSLPLPGTPQRRQAETEQLLENALSGYDYIAAARTTFAAGLSEIETTDSPRLSLQLQLQSAPALPHNWLENLVTFVLHTVPGLGPTDLLITDSHGEVLYAKGQPTVAASMTSSPSAPGSPISKPKAVFEIPSVAWGLAALLAIVLAALYLLQARGGSQQAQMSGQAAFTETAASQPPQLEQLLRGLTAGQITSLAEGERPEVVAALLHHVPNAETAAAARQQMNAPPGSLSEPARPMRKETLVSFTEALRTRLAASQNTLGNGGDHSE